MNGDEYSYKFKLHSHEVEEDTFSVIAFKGVQAIGEIGCFTLILASRDPAVNFQEVLSKKAALTMSSQGSIGITFSGVVKHISQKQHFHEHYVYEVELVSKLYLLTMTKYYRIFMGKTIPEIIEEILISSGLNRSEFEFHFVTPFVKTEYVCQFGESNYAFVKRWMERTGIYSYSAYDEGGEKIIFTDNKFSHQVDALQNEMYYSTVGLADSKVLHKTTTAVEYSFNRVPQKVTVKDYFYERPTRNPIASSDIDAEGFGELYTFNPNVYTDERLQYFADIKAQAQACKKENLVCESFVMNAKPGYIYTLNGHPREALNRKYLALSIAHYGVVPAYLNEGFKVDSEHDHPHNYHNSITLIPSDTQFRLDDVTPKPVAPGMISAKIDAETSGLYPHIDEQGRYKVIMPFDLNVSKEGKASIWLRMAQPSAGEGQGMHFPLRKGTEVLIDFVGGNPDNPFIAAAVPNPLTQSPVTDRNLTKSKILSATGNALIIDDEVQHESIHMEVPKKDTSLTLGHYIDKNGAQEDGISFNAPSYFGTVLGNHFSRVSQNHTLEVSANSSETVQETKTLHTTNYNITATGSSEKSDDKTEEYEFHREYKGIGIDITYNVDLDIGPLDIDAHGVDLDICPLLDVDFAGASIEIQGYRYEKTKYCAEDKELKIKLNTLEMHDHALQKCIVDYYKSKSYVTEVVGQIKKEKSELEKKISVIGQQAFKMQNCEINLYKNGPAIIIGES